MINILRKIKQAVPVSVKVRARYWLSNSSYDSFDFCREKPKAIIALAADYANLGDVAITHAQTRFLEAFLPGYEIVYFPCASTFVHMKALKRVCSSEDLITIIGGGNMGDQYAELEDGRRFIIEQFPRNRIISFPQTIDFSDTARGKRELEKTRRIYGRHKNIHLFAREPVSYEMMTQIFPDKAVSQVPDIVLSLDESSPPHARRGVLLCMRDDAESVLPTGKRGEFMNCLQKNIGDLSVADTVTRNLGKICLEEGQKRLHDFLELVRKSEVVVTDRLHGMILSAITGTPCVALENSNHKIRGTYVAWLSDMKHIRLQDGFDPELTTGLVRELRELEASLIQPLHLRHHFASLGRAVRGVP